MQSYHYRLAKLIAVIKSKETNIEVLQMGIWVKRDISLVNSVTAY